MSLETNHPSSPAGAVSPAVPQAVIALLFFLSGMSSLIFETVWMRKLVLVFGSTSFAVATTVAAFMGGLGLGSYIFGRLSDRMRNHVAVYGILEAVVGAYGLMVPLVLSAAIPLYRSVWESFHLSFYPFSLVRFLLAFAVLVVPTTMMGATLPVLSKYCVKSAGMIGRGVGRLYAVNTTGAVAGTFLAGFVFIPFLGESGTTILASAMNFAIAAIAIVSQIAVSRRGAAPAPAAVADAAVPPAAVPAPAPRAGIEEYRRGIAAAVLFVFAVSGFASMTYQIAWARLLSLIIGSSVYAFSIIVTVFLAGLACGSAVMARKVPSLRKPATTLAWVEILIGVSVMAGVFLYDYEFYLFAKMFASGSMASVMLINLLLAAIVIFLPTFLSGAAFPLAVSVYSKEIGKLGREIGEVYTVNTLGSIAGSFMAGFVLLPFLGIKSSIVAALLLNVAAGAGLLIMVRSGGGRSRAAALAASVAAAALALLALPEPDPYLMSTGVFKNADLYTHCRSFSEFRTNASEIRRKIVMHKEGITTTVTVSKFPTQFAVAVNGKVDGSSVGDMETQCLSGHLPLLFADNPSRVLVVGYGTGVTAGVVTLYPGIKATCVELEHAIIEAGKHFSHVNYDTGKLVEAGRLEIIEDDGRNHLLAGSEKYDVIISEPSNPWMSGSSKLFTKEFFEIAAERLSPGGVFGQWVQLYGMDETNVRCLIKTFMSVFKSVVVFNTAYKADLLVVGRKDGSLSVPLERAEALFSMPGPAADLRRLGINSAADLISYFLVDGNGIAEFLSCEEVPFNTDDNSFIEFNAPRTLHVKGKMSQIHEKMIECMQSPFNVFRTSAGPEDRARILLRAGSYAISTEKRVLSESLLRVLDGESPPGGGSGPFTASRWFLKGLIEMRKTEYRAAAEAFESAVKAEPDNHAAVFMLGRALAADGRWQEALDRFLRVLSLSPGRADAVYWKGVCLAELGANEQALACFEEVLKAARGVEIHQDVLFHMARVQNRLGRSEAAVECLLKLIARTPSHKKGAELLRKISKSQAWTAQAREIMALGRDEKKGQEIFGIAETYIKYGGSLAEAADLLAEAADENAFDVEFYDMVTKRLVVLGQHEKAFEVFRKALKVFPSDVKLLQNFAYYLEIQGGRKGADGTELFREAATVLRTAFPKASDPLVANEISRRMEILDSLMAGTNRD